MEFQIPFQLSASLLFILCTVTVSHSHIILALLYACHETQTSILRANNKQISKHILH